MLKKNVVNASIWAAIFTMALIILITVSSWFGEEIEELLAPPLFKNVKTLVVNVDADYMEILVSGTKNRGCDIVSFAADVKINGSTFRTEKIQLLKQDGSPLKLEDQRVAEGSPFVRRVRISPVGTFVEATVSSRCHPFWVSTQHLFSIEVPKALVR